MTCLIIVVSNAELFISPTLCNSALLRFTGVNIKANMTTKLHIDKWMFVFLTDNYLKLLEELRLRRIGRLADLFLDELQDVLRQPW